LTILIVVAVLVAVLGLGQTSEADSPTVVVVSPADMHGWAFFLESGSTGSGQMVIGPATPPVGVGSARLTVQTISDGMVLGRPGWNGVHLDQITTLKYSTYRTSGGPALAISLQFNIDDDVTDADNSWKGRLVFEPYYTETVNTGVWQTWDPMTQGKWWGTGYPINTKCNINSPCTWPDVLGNFPHAGIHHAFGAILFKAGSGWAGFDGNVDTFTIAVSGVETTYDFEPFPNVSIDIKPGSFPNSINPKSRGRIPVAILSTVDFDAPSEVDPLSLTFGRTGDEPSLAFCNASPEDVNGDGLLDLVCHFTTQQTGFQTGDTEGVLKGKTVDATPIEGRDSVRIVP